MSNIHFTSTEEYRRRVIQLGENPKTVFCYGAPGSDSLKHMKFLSRKELEKELGISLQETTALVTYHPDTLENSDPNEHINALLTALRNSGLNVLFTQANADPHGKTINKAIKKFCKRSPQKYKLVPSLGSQRYLSCLKHFQLLVGNSSSGIIEAPSFKIPVVNIGDRQRGRTRAKNIIDVGFSAKEIEKGIKVAMSAAFLAGIQNIENPYVKYKDGRIGFRIKEQLKILQINNRLFKKPFYNIF